MNSWKVTVFFYVSGCAVSSDSGVDTYLKVSISPASSSVSILWCGAGNGCCRQEEENPPVTRPVCEVPLYCWPAAARGWFSKSREWEGYVQTVTCVVSPPATTDFRGCAALPPRWHGHGRVALRVLHVEKPQRHLLPHFQSVLFFGSNLNVHLLEITFCALYFYWKEAVIKHV